MDGAGAEPSRPGEDRSPRGSGERRTSSWQWSVTEMLLQLELRVGRAPSSCTCSMAAQGAWSEPLTHSQMPRPSLPDGTLLLGAVKTRGFCLPSDLCCGLCLKRGVSAPTEGLGLPPPPPPDSLLFPFPTKVVARDGLSLLRTGKCVFFFYNL